MARHEYMVVMDWLILDCHGKDVMPMHLSTLQRFKDRDPVHESLTHDYVQGHLDTRG